MSLTEYETTMIIRPDVGGDAVESVLDRVRDVVRGMGGKVVGIDHWGKKKLAYEIQKQSRGIYVHAHYLGPRQLVAELERNLRISDHVIRFLSVQLAESVDAAEREERAYVRPQYDLESDDTAHDRGHDDTLEMSAAEDDDGALDEEVLGDEDDMSADMDADDEMKE